MAPFYNNSTLLIYNYNGTFYNNQFDLTTLSRVIAWTVILLGFPLTLLAIYALRSLVRNDHVAPVYVINLLISDLLQLCCLTIKLADPNYKIMNIAINIHNFGVAASVCFMVCVAMERYLAIAWPLYYHFRRTIKLSVVVCVMVWTLSLVYVLSLYFGLRFAVARIIIAVSLLIPFPLLIFFLGGTLKALSAANRVPSDEKLRIVGILVLVLLIYMLLYLPYVICALAEETRNNWILFKLSVTLIMFSPLADLILYVFMKKGAIDKLLACLCCCTMDSRSSE